MYNNVHINVQQRTRSKQHQRTVSSVCVHVCDQHSVVLAFVYAGKLLRVWWQQGRQQGQGGLLGQSRRCDHHRGGWLVVGPCT